MPDSNRARGPYRKGVERRREIVAAAAKLFAESGYTHSSMRELAKRVGVSQALLLHYFSDKEDLLVEVLNLRDASVADYLSQIAETDIATRSREVARHSADHEGLTSLYIALSAEAINPDHPAHAYFVEHYRSAQEQTREPDSTQDSASIGVSHDMVATLGIAVQDGLQTQRRYRPDLDGVATVDAFWELVAAARSWWSLQVKNSAAAASGTPEPPPHSDQESSNSDPSSESAQPPAPTLQAALRGDADSAGSD